MAHELIDAGAGMRLPLCCSDPHPVRTHAASFFGARGLMSQMWRASYRTVFPCFMRASCRKISALPPC
jgi:hypothetical protein